MSITCVFRSSLALNPAQLCLKFSCFERGISELWCERPFKQGLLKSLLCVCGDKSQSFGCGGSTWNILLGKLWGNWELRCCQINTNFAIALAGFSHVFRELQTWFTTFPLFASPPFGLLYKGLNASVGQALQCLSYSREISHKNYDLFFMV